MSVGLDRISLAVLLTISACLILLTATASVGLYNIDEVLYLLSAETFHETGSFVINNGRDEFASHNLTLRLFVDGPEGLVSQYPIGTTVAAAPLIDIFGQKSIMMLNLLAGLGTLFATHALVQRLFASTDVANLTVVLFAVCTFWTEFVVGHWTHSVSILFVVLSCLVFVAALDSTRFSWHPAFWCGSLVGLGMFFRLEGILLLPAIIALTILYAKKPIHVLVGGILGFAPTMMLMSYSNLIRFDTFNPISYGQGGGGTDLSTYIVPGVAVLICLAALVVLRQFGDVRYRRVFGVLVATIVVLCAVFVPAVQSGLLRVLNGMHAILIDATAMPDTPSNNLRQLDDGAVLFSGLPKKALGQSLPWLGCLAALVGLAMAKPKRNVLFVLVIFAAWSIPFVFQSWHGGFGSNMRYFLPTLPLLAALSAWVIIELGQRLEKNDIRIVVLPAVAAYFVVSVWLFFAPEKLPWIHQMVSFFLLIAITIVSLVAGLFAKRLPTLFALSAIGAGLGLSSVLAIHDYGSSQTQRTFAAAHSDAVASIPGKVLFFGPSKRYFAALQKEQQYVAVNDTNRADLDFALIDEACRLEYRIILEDYLIQYLGPFEAQVIDFNWEAGGKELRLNELVCNP